MFNPDYTNIVEAANNRPAKRLPLYEHGFAHNVIEAIMGFEVAPLFYGGLADKTEAYRRICQFAIQHGYDCIPFECLSVNVVQGGAGLAGHGKPLIQTLEDLEAFPWESRLDEYVKLHKEYCDAVTAALPPGMKAVGGVGCGVMEVMQDFVPFQELAFLQVDEPEVYEKLWVKIGDMLMELWRWMLENYADSFAVCRFGDDLGFRTSTLLQPNEIRKHIIPQYKRIVDMVHAAGKPFLLHSCGKIYEVMDDIIDEVGIDAKHSNEDAIDTFDVWVNRYGDRIGNFGGIEMNIMTLNTPDEVKQYVRDLLPKIEGHGGVAIGTGNQVSSYTEPANFIAMTEAVREWRGEQIP